MEPLTVLFCQTLKPLHALIKWGYQTILNVVRFNRGRVIFGHGSNIPETESDLPPAPRAVDRLGFDEVDSRNETREMLDNARDITF